MSYTAKAYNRSIQVYNIMFGKKLTDFWKQNNKTEQSSAGSQNSEIKNHKMLHFWFAGVDRHE